MPTPLPSSLKTASTLSADASGRKTIPKAALVVAPHAKAKKGGSMPIKVTVGKIEMHTPAPKKIQPYGKRPA